MIHDIVKEQAAIDINPENSDNDILNNLNKYLNGKFEAGREDYQRVSAHDIPAPVLQENGLWGVPGTSKTFKTSTEAYRAVQRYTEYLTQNDASMLMYGVDYNKYIHGDDELNESRTISEIKASEPREGDNESRSDIPIRTGNEPVPETPADHTTTS